MHLPRYQRIKAIKLLLYKGKKGLKTNCREYLKLICAKKLQKIDGQIIFKKCTPLILGRQNEEVKSKYFD